MKTMKSKFHALLYLGFALVLFSSCTATRSSAKLYSEQSVSTDKVRFRTVAIIPNRMPITLQDPEFWRQYNWQLIANNFTARGYKVIDYNTTVSSFTRSGLPLEDTKSSRDKYADFANEINAELIVIPYYGTSYNLKSGFLANTHNYVSIGSLQFYYAPQNDFIARVDFDGVFETETSAPGAYMVGSLFPMLADKTDPESITTMSTFSLLYTVALFLKDIGAPTNPIVNWKTAFNSGVSKGTSAFFDKYSPVPANNYEAPRQLSAPVSNYSSFSLEELELLKKNAVEKKDFKKAADLKVEIDRRK